MNLYRRTRRTSNLHGLSPKQGLTAVCPGRLFFSEQTSCGTFRRGGRNGGEKRRLQRRLPLRDLRGDTERQTGVPVTMWLVQGAVRDGRNIIILCVLRGARSKKAGRSYRLDTTHFIMFLAAVWGSQQGVGSRLKVEGHHAACCTLSEDVCVERNNKNKPKKKKSITRNKYHLCRI